MMKQKMPDEQIEQGLECCSLSNQCARCPYGHLYTDYLICSDILMVDALVYIHRLKAKEGSAQS